MSICRSAVYAPGQLITGATLNRDSTRHVGRAVPAFLASARPVCRVVLRGGRQRTKRPGLGGGNSVTYADRNLSCVDCGVEFIHSAADQEFYSQKGFSSDPKRCASCRASRRTA